MSHGETPDHGHAPSAVPEHGGAPAEQTFFPPDEWQSFHDQDIVAGKYIIGLMFSIFVIGLCLYSGVALWVANRPQY